MVSEEFIGEIETRLVKSFLDIIILQVIAIKGKAGGYELNRFLTDRFKRNLSSGTLYAAMYLLERKGLIQGEAVDRKTVYSLSQKGVTLLDNIRSSDEELRRFTALIFGNNNDWRTLWVPRNPSKPY